MSHHMMKQHGSICSWALGSLSTISRLQWRPVMHFCPYYLPYCGMDAFVPWAKYGTTRARKPARKPWAVVSECGVGSAMGRLGRSAGGAGACGCARARLSKCGCGGKCIAGTRDAHVALAMSALLFAYLPGFNYRTGLCNDFTGVGEFAGSRLKAIELYMYMHPSSVPRGVITAFERVWVLTCPPIALMPLTSHHSAATSTGFTSIF